MEGHEHDTSNVNVSPITAVLIFSFPEDRFIRGENTRSYDVDKNSWRIVHNVPDHPMQDSAHVLDRVGPTLLDDRNRMR